MKTKYSLVSSRAFRRQFIPGILGTVFVFSMVAPEALGQDVWWDRGSGSNAWGTGGNWSATNAAAATTGAVPGTGNVAVFNITALTANQTIDMGGNREIAGMSFATSGSVLIDGGSAARTLTLRASGITKSGTGAITIGSTTAAKNVNVRLYADQTWANNNNTGIINIVNTVAASSATDRKLTLGGTSTAGNIINGVVSNNGAGVFSLDKTGAGLWVLAGANTFTGTVNITGGTLRIQNSTGLGAGTVVDLGTGSTLDIRNTITVAAGKTLTMNSNNTGDLRSSLISGANNNTWNSDIVASGTGLTQIYANGGTLNIGGNITSTGGGGTGTLFTRGSGTVIYNGNVTLGADRIFNKTDGGTVIVNSTGNSWVRTQAADGQMQIGINDALANVELTIGQGSATNGRFEMNGFSQSVTRLNTWGGNPSHLVGGATASSGTNHIIRNSNLTTASTLTFATPDATTDKLINVQIQGTATSLGTLSLVSNGLGRTEFENGLVAANSWTVNDGTIAFTGTTNRVLPGSVTGLAAATIEKAGASNLTATSTWNNAGTTNITGGALVLGTGTAGGVNVSGGATLSTGFDGGVLSSTAVTFGTGATTYAPLLTTAGAAAPLSAASLTANDTVTVTPQAATFTAGTYRLLDYAGTIGGAGGFTLGGLGTIPHMTASLDTTTTPGQVNLVVGVVDSLIWTGISGIWNVNNAANFALASNPTGGGEKFYQGDAVTFGDTHDVGTPATPVANTTITGDAVAIGNLTFTNSLLNYSVANILTGPGGISKSGTGTLTLSGANVLGGGAVNVTGGTLKIGNSDALRGAGLVTVSGGGTFDANGTAVGTRYPELVVSGAGADTNADMIGDGAVVNNGAAITNLIHFAKIILAGDTTWGGTGRYDMPVSALFLGGTSTLTKVGTNEAWWGAPAGSTLGPVIVNGGVFGVQTAVAMAAGDASITVNATGTLGLYGSATVARPVTLDGGAISGRGGATTPLAGIVTLQAGDVLGVPVNRLGSTGTNAFAVTGSLVGAGGFEKIDTGTVQIQSTGHTYAGNTLISAGTLNFNATGGLPTTTNLIVNGGTFDPANLTHTFASLSGTGGTIGQGTAGTGKLVSTQSEATVFNGTVARINVTMNGTGSLTLGGTADNSTASINVENGTVILAKGNTAAVGQTIHAVATGNLNMNGGTAQLAGTYNNTTLATGANAPPTGFDPATYGDLIYNPVAVNLNAGIFDLNGRQEAINVLANPTGAGGTVTNTSTSATASKLYIGHQNGTSTFAGAINDGTGTVAIEKIGTGTLTLTGTSNFTGGLIQTAGTTFVSSTGVLGNTPITVAENTFTLDGTHGTGAIVTNGSSVFQLNGTSGNGTITANDTSTITLNGTHGTGAIALNGTSVFAGAGTSGGTLTSPVGTTVQIGTAGGSAATLTLGGLSLGGGTVAFDIGAAGVNDALAVSNFTLAANSAFTFNPIGAIASGTYTLLTSVNTITNSGPFTISGQTAGRLTLTPVFNSNSVTLTAALAEGEWNQPGGGIWSLGNPGGPSAPNWNNYKPTVAGDGALFGSLITGNATITVDSAHVVGYLRFNNANVVTIGGNGSSNLTLNTGVTGASAQVTVNTGSHIIAENVALASSANVSPASGTTLTVSGALSGAGGLTLNDVGSLVLSGANSYLGTTAINAGTLTLSGTGTLGSATSPLTLGGGQLNLGTLSLPTVAAVSITTPAASGDTILNGTLTGTSFAVSNPAGNVIISANLSGTASTFSKSGAGTVTLAGTNLHTGATTVSDGTLKLASDTALTSATALTMSGTGLLDLNGFSVSTGGITSAVTTSTITNTSAAVTASTATALNTPSGAGVYVDALTSLTGGNIAALVTDGPTRRTQLVFNNANGNAALSNDANSFSGGLVLQHNATGTRLSPGVVTGTRYGSGPIIIGQMPTDKAGIYFGSATSLGNPIIFNTALGTDRVGIRADAAVTLSGVITANLAPATFTSNAGTAGSFLLTNQVTGSSGLVIDITSLTAGATAFNLTLNNSGTPNDYAGDTVINFAAANGKSATLTLGQANQIPDGTGKGNVIINSNGTGIGLLNLAGYSETINGLSGSGTVDGISGTPTLSLGDNNASGDFSGILKNTGGTLTVTKIGTGTQTLSGASTFTGPLNVNGGLVAFPSSPASAGPLGNSTTVNLNGGGISYTAAGANPLSRPITIGASAGTVDVENPTGALNITSVTSTAGNLIKTGPGAAVISGSTTLNGGAAGVAVNDGTLQAGFGTGGVSAISVAATGNLRMQNSATENLTLGSTVGALTLAGGSRLGFEVNAATNDSITVGATGTPVTTAGVVTLDLIDSGAGIASGNTYTLLSTTNGDLTFGGLTSYAIGVAPSGFNYTLSVTAKEVKVTVEPFSPAFWTNSQGTGSWSTLNAGPASNFSIDPAGNNNFAALPSASETVNFSADFVGGPTVDTTLDGNFTLYDLNFLAGSGTVTAVSIAQGGILTIQPTNAAGGIDVGTNAGNVTIGASLVASNTASPSQTWNVDGTGANSSLAINGVTTFTANVIKSGAGALTLGNAGNTGAGNFTLGSGTLNISATGNLPTGVFTIGSGTMIDNTGGAGITLSSIGHIWNGNFTKAGQSLDLGSGAVTMGADVVATIPANTLTVGGGIDDGIATYGLTKADAGDLVLNGDNGYDGLTTMNAGVLTLAGDNSGASGGVTLTAGQLNINSDNALGTGLLTLSGGTFDNTDTVAHTQAGNPAQTWTNAANIAFIGTRPLNLGTGAVTLGTNATTGSFTLTNNSALAGTTLTVGGDISAVAGGAAGVKTLTIAGPGSTALTGSITKGSAANVDVTVTSGGTTTLSGAASSIRTINIDGGASSIVDLGAGNLTITNGGTNGFRSATGGTINATGGGKIVLGSDLLDNGTANGTTLTVNAGITGPFTFEIYGGAANTGVTVLTAQNTFTGRVDINGGNLSVSNIGNTGSLTSNLGSGTTIRSGAATLNAGTVTTGKLIYTGAGETTNRILSMNGAGFAIEQAAISGNLLFTADVEVPNNAAKTLFLLGSTDGTGELGGVIPNNTAATNVTKLGTGTWTLSGANTYTGNTTVSAGLLRLTGAKTGTSGIITAGDTAGSNATLDITNGTYTIGGAGSRFRVGDQPTTAGTGTVNQSGGTIVFTAGGDQLLVGQNTVGNTGVYNLSGGSVTTATSPSRGVILGVNSNLTPGPTSGGGTFNLSGTGALNMTAASGGSGNAILQIGRSDAAANNTTNVFNQTGGTANVGILAMGGAAAGSTGVSSTLTLTGGTFSASSFTLLAAGATNTAVINIGETAVVTLPAFPKAKGAGSTATITFDSGATGFLSPAAISANYMPAETFDNAYLTANGAKINVGAGNDITIGQKLENAPAAVGTLTKQGPGVLTLTGANDYTGDTTVSLGTLALVGGSQASPITVSGVASLGFTLGSPTTTSSTVAFSAGSTVKITGTPASSSYTLITASGGITGTPVLDTPSAYHVLKIIGNTLVLEYNPYEAWANANVVTGGKLGDDDTDGLNNVNEFAFGTDPKNSTGPMVYVAGGDVTTPGVPVLLEEGGTYYAVFCRRKDYLAAGLTYTVQFSADLSSPWVPSGATPTLVTGDPSNGGIEAVKVPFPGLIPTDSGPLKARFFQVGASVAP